MIKEQPFVKKQPTPQFYVFFMMLEVLKQGYINTRGYQKVRILMR